MDQTRVRELFALLPPGAAYPATPRRSPFQPRPGAPERFALALRDPAFGWNFVAAHLRTGRWLPDTINEWPLLQAFAVRWFQVNDPLLLEVESFRTEIRRQDRNLLEALLLADDASLADIAALFQTSEEVVEAYEVLFWNVRARKREQAYLNALLHPDGWQAAARDARLDAAGDRLRLLRAGADLGRAQVLMLAGIEAFPAESASGHWLLEQDADRRWRAGARLEDPVIRARHQIALRWEPGKPDDDGLGLRHLSDFLCVTKDLLQVASRKIEPGDEEGRRKFMEQVKAAQRAPHGGEEMPEA